ncbi:MAG: hypothetical protein Q9183_001879 [Haloplaca sp. 2 TL-2023]
MLHLSLTVVFVAIIIAWIQLPLAGPFKGLIEQRLPGDLDSFLATENAVALQGILDNIGSIGKEVEGADSGIVVASPSRVDPDYFYTWTRDAALTFKVLIDHFIAGETSLQPRIEDYISAQAVLQTVTNPSGDLTDGSGLGEPKFEVNSTAFESPWGRPQRDGPALRATALIAYSQWLLDNGREREVSTTIWPIISNDLSYVGQYWNQTGFDLWEESEGSSFFTIAVQHRSLVEGQALAERIGATCSSCASQAAQVLCFLQAFWNGQFVISNINARSIRNGRDANSILASIQTFDPDAACDDATFQPCSSRALSNHKMVTDSFRPLYSINAGIPNVYQFDRLGSLDVVRTSLPFYQDLYPSVAIGTYPKDSPVYNEVISAIKNYADGYVGIVQKYTPSDGSLAEQYSGEDGTPKSATDLTWSYAAFLTAVARRRRNVPSSWGASAVSAPPKTCRGTSAPGTYRSSPISCSSNASAFPVTFDVRKVTSYGETVYVSGSDAGLGAWNEAEALQLQASRYTDSDPLWTGTSQPLAAGEDIEYKYFKTGINGIDIQWEGGSNRIHTVPEGCAKGVVRSDVWQQ